MRDLLVDRPDLATARWTDGAVIVELGPTPGISRFPAMPHAMLAMTLVHPADAAGCDSDARGSASAPPHLASVGFHTLSTVPTSHAHAGRLTAIGLLVRPAAAACLLGASTGAKVDQVIDWRVIAGEHEAARLEDEVDRAATRADRLQALRASFARTMSVVARGRDEACAPWIDAIGRHGLQAASALGCSPRQLERRSRALVGLAPKPFQRLVRLHGALSSALLEAPARGAEIAASLGYYDQSHLARELRALAGESLTGLLEAAQVDAPWWSLASHRALHRRSPG